MRIEPKKGVFKAIFILFIAIVQIISIALTMIIGGLFYHFGIISGRNISGPVIGIFLFSVLFASLLTLFLGKKPLYPINNLIDGLNQLANGNYKVRLNLGLRGYGVEIENQFNILAEELENTELLRSDFVNNFSHELKTPIVSIRGFAKLIQKDDLPKEKQKEYIDIIIEESTRLSDMATNVLSLTKLENQNILSEVSCFNLSEQIRNCLLILEKKWMRKSIEVSANFKEIEITANEEMLKQVWINLLDNAIKFCDERGKVTICIKKKQNQIVVTIENKGSHINEQEKKRIFQKFYQSDQSHASEGNGIGLAIVKRVLEIHKGDIHVDGDENSTQFIVILPEK